MEQTGIIQQGSLMWLEQRIGCFTSSEIHRLMGECKTKEDREKGLLNEKAKTYVLEKVWETMTGKSKDFINDATAWGNEQEPIASYWYEQKTGFKAIETGFIKCGESYGGSPDRLIGNDGMCEIKCPYNGAYHIEHLLITDQEYLKKYFSEFYWQIQSNLFITGRSWCDFVSFDPRINSDAGFFQIRIFIDSDDCDKIAAQVEKAVKMKFELLNKFSGEKTQGQKM